MKNKWKNDEANRYINYYKKNNISKELALRIYTTHLLGREKELVLHGGGNTSLKSSISNIFNQKINIMYVKGSGWNMSNIDHPGLPAVELDPLLKTIKLNKLNDFNMVNLVRKSLLNSNAPNPSVETLLHSFLPFKYIDHTHANAILSLIDQPNDIKICQNVFGNKVGIVPYVIPGFELAKKTLQIFNKNKNIIGLILLKHGIFTFGNNAKESYDRMIKLVSIAEKQINKNIINNKIIKNNKKLLNQSVLFPLLRKYLSFKEKNDSYIKWIFDIRNNNKVIKYLEHPKLYSFSQRGPVTPDHVIRTKPKPLIIDLKNKKFDEYEKIIKKEIDRFRLNYHKYFLRNKKYLYKSLELDGNPRLVLIPGMGIIGIGRTKKEALIAADLAECTVEVISKAESFGKFSSISEKEIFKIEYWPLEQAKLKNIKRASLTGNITVISGGCGTIGLAIAKEFHNEGSEIILLDNNLQNINNTPSEIRKFAKIIKCNVTKESDVKKAFIQISKTYGGMDILISNAGAAWQGNIGKVANQKLRESFDLNFYAHQYLSQEATKLFIRQNTGGILLYNISKQSINPGMNFGPYGIPKASTLFLMRQYALEYGKYGIRANGVNADRIRSGILNNNLIKSRAKSRDLSEKNYMTSNLLKTEVFAQDVASAFLHLAKSNKTTANVMTVDGGNMSAILR